MSKVKISELLEKLYKGYLLSDMEYNMYLSLIDAYKSKESKTKTKVIIKTYKGI